jgi:hypothetical protein
MQAIAGSGAKHGIVVAHITRAPQPPCASSAASACRCAGVPRRALQTAADLFTHTDLCRADGKQALPTSGAFTARLRTLSQHDTADGMSASRRRLDFETQEGMFDEQRAADVRRRSWSEGDTAAPGRRLRFDKPENMSDEQWAAELRQRPWLEKEPSVPEMGQAREEEFLKRAHGIHGAQIANLRKTGWLGGFEPMLLTCPLVGRKVAPETVAEYAAIAWHCGGLGFAWECLRAQADAGGVAAGAA